MSYAETSQQRKRTLTVGINLSIIMQRDFVVHSYDREEERPSWESLVMCFDHDQAELEPEGYPFLVHFVTNRGPYYGMSYRNYKEAVNEFERRVESRK